MTKPIYIYDWLKYCPACGESGHLYWTASSHYDINEDPQPYEAHCERCGYGFVESSQHNPQLIDVMRHRWETIRELRKTLRQLERWEPKP